MRSREVIEQEIRDANSELAEVQKKLTVLVRELRGIYGSMKMQLLAVLNYGGEAEYNCYKNKAILKLLYDRNCEVALEYGLEELLDSHVCSTFADHLEIMELLDYEAISEETYNRIKDKCVVVPKEFFLEAVEEVIKVGASAVRLIKRTNENSEQNPQLNIGNVTCPCGAIIPDENIDKWNTCNEVGEEYGVVVANCEYCGADYETSQWGEWEDLEEAKSYLQDSLNEQQ
jgi:hypothetical protein